MCWVFTIILMGADRFAKLKILDYYNDKHADTYVSKQTFAYEVQNSVKSLSSVPECLDFNCKRISICCELDPENLEIANISEDPHAVATKPSP